MYTLQLETLHNMYITNVVCAINVQLLQQNMIKNLILIKKLRTHYLSFGVIFLSVTIEKQVES